MEDSILKEVVYNGEQIDLNREPINTIEKRLEEVAMDNKNIKKTILEILEEF